MPQNPFFPGKQVPPKSFVGRTSEINAAFDQIHNRSHLAIWGGPGMGKSSFLEKLASPQVWNEHRLDPSGAVIVFFSCETIVPFSASGFWRKVLSLLSDRLESEHVLQADIETLLKKGQTTQDSLRKVLQKLGQQGKFLVLLVDDYDAALRKNQNDEYTEADMEEFLSECRSLAVHTPERQYLSMIVTSLKRLNELGPGLNLTKSPWYNHYLFQGLKPFTAPETDQLLNILRTPPLALRDTLREIAGGHPALLQIAGSLLYRELQTEKEPDAEAFIKDFKSKTTQIFQNIWGRCSKEEQTLLMLMALSNLKGRLHKNKQFDLSGIDLIFTQRERELTNLEQQGVITRTLDEEKTVYHFTSSIMERWVIQEIWNTNEQELKERQKEFLNLMSHQQAQNLTDAIRWLWQQKNDVPSAFGLIERVLNMLYQLFGR